jgi:HEXXH motif-containing protein
MLEHFPWVAKEAGEADARRFIMVRGLSAYPALVERVQRTESRIAWLPQLLSAQAPEKVIRASPYFWASLKQAFAVLAARGSQAELDRALDRVALAALDSFAGVPTGFPRGVFPVPSLAGAQLLRTGVSFDSQVQIKAAEAHAGAISFVLEGGARLRVAIPGPLMVSVSQVWPVRRMEDASIDLGRSAQRLEQEEAAISALVPKLHQAMAWTQKASSAVAELIRSEVQYLVPLCSSPSSHYSFTLSNLPGLLFVGGAEHLLPIVEAIVHETGHARLHHANELYPLVQGEQPKFFYSPWRPDPRPATGVFHGAYVFTLVLGFWMEVLAAYRGTLDLGDEAYISSRIALIALQLREAVAVLDRASLSLFGESVLRSLRAIIPPVETLPLDEAVVASALRTTRLMRGKAAAEFPDLVFPAA